MDATQIKVVPIVNWGSVQVGNDLYVFEEQLAFIANVNPTF